MAKHYVTMGRGHKHQIQEKLIDHDTVVVYEAKDSREGREIADKLFDGQFFMDYHDNQWEEGNINMYPLGYVVLDVDHLT